MTEIKNGLKFFTVICLIAVCSVFFTAYAADVLTEGIFTYTVTDSNTAKITNIETSDLTEIHIPETLGGYTVIGLDSRILSTTETVDVYIPKTVESIDYSAFFSDTAGRFFVDGENKNYSNDELGVLFNKDKTALVKVPCCFEPEEYVVPNTVVEIKSKALSDTSLKHITLLDGLESIGFEAFMYSQIEKIIIPDTVTFIDQLAFAACSKLKEIVLPPQIKVIGSSTLTECYALEKVIIPDGVTSLKIYAFENDTALKFVYIPKSVTRIDSGAFGNCKNLTDICYAGNEEDWAKIEIDMKPYHGDRPVILDTATIHYGVSADGYENLAIDNNDGVLSVSGPSSIPALSENGWSYLHQNKDDVYTLVIDGEISSVGSYAFKDFSNLSAVIVKTPKVQIESNAFINCPKLKNIIFLSDSGLTETSFNLCAKTVNIFEDSSAKNNFADSSGSLNVVLYTFENGVLSFSGNVSFGTYEFFDTLSALSLKYNNIEKVRFSSLVFEDIQLYYFDENFVLQPIEENKLINGEIYPSIDGIDAITFNELLNGISDKSIDNFFLITEAENHDDIDSPEVNIWYEEVKEFFERALRWIVTLLNKLFRFLSKH